jgi:hypothetical protein
MGRFSLYSSHYEETSAPSPAPPTAVAHSHLCSVQAGSRHAVLDEAYDFTPMDLATDTDLFRGRRAIMLLPGKNKSCLGLRSNQFMKRSLDYLFGHFSC